MTLSLFSNILDSIDTNSSVCEDYRMVDPLMMKVAHIESIVDFEGVSLNNTVGFYFFLDDRQQILKSCVRDNSSENLHSSLKQTEHGHFPGCSSTSLSFASSSEVTFIRFDFHTQLATGKFACSETTKAHEKTGCGVAMDAHDLNRPDSP